MGWFFKGGSGDEKGKLGAENDESYREEQLLKELPDELSCFYRSETRMNEFKFKESDQNETLFKAHTQGQKTKILAATNCAEFEAEFVDCVTNGPWKERLTGCDVQNKRIDKCMKLQRLLFYELGLQYTKNVNRFEKITGTADDLGMKWFDQFDEKKNALSHDILTDTYEQRDKIWK